MTRGHLSGVPGKDPLLPAPDVLDGLLIPLGSVRRDGVGGFCDRRTRSKGQDRGGQDNDGRPGNKP